MASNKKVVEVIDYTIQEKIIALYDLQKIDTKIDEIQKNKGELPIEVQDLEDEVAGLQTRIDNVHAEIEELNMLVRQRKEEIEQDKALIIKYNEQQRNVRNNREFDSISKEIEYQELQIELCEKHLKEYTAESKIKKKNLEDTVAIKADRELALKEKKEELESIDAETAKEVGALTKLEDIARAKIDERLGNAYARIRANVRNGLAVVTIQRDACGGCYNEIPPQRQSEVRQVRKIIICEHCGRILVPEEMPK